MTKTEEETLRSTLVNRIVRHPQVQDLSKLLHQYAQGFPAVHHSDIYERLYHPVYRVVTRALLEEA
jgi:hypothetical protein